ncbi:MAG: LicD family protein [Synergistaceae bacterium]|nr:LicD family protein [Synergistaceae bacterium]
MRRLTLDEIRKIQLEILDTVMDFCAERGINCWLNGGTLLGAVRHKGYIPWDDDIDLGMLRPDYDRFMAEFNGYNPRYEFRSIENDPECEFAFGKVFDNTTVVDEPLTNITGMALNVDIFVMDNAPDDDRIVRDMFRKRIAYIRAVRCIREGIFPARWSIMSIKRRICVAACRIAWKIVHFFPPKSARFDYIRKIAENSKRYADKKTARVGDFVGWHCLVCRRELLENLTELEFEGKMYKVPAGYDEWLRGLYGDYMTPPPPGKRISHQLIAYKKD